jgi:PRTRC genetic system ThiF family protein
LFSAADVGAYKCETLINRLNCYYHLDWQAVPKPLVEHNRYHGEAHPDFLIGCVDSAAARRTFRKVRFDYWLDLGNTDKKGQVILGTRNRVELTDLTKPAGFGRVFGKLQTVLEIFPELKNTRRKEDTAPSCSLAEALERQDLFINQSVATFALQLLWQFLRQGRLTVHGYFINLETGRVTPLPIKPKLQGSHEH